MGGDARHHTFPVSARGKPVELTAYGVLGRHGGMDMVGPVDVADRRDWPAVIGPP
jgi:hypothetical protein